MSKGTTIDTITLEVMMIIDMMMIEEKSITMELEGITITTEMRFTIIAENNPIRIIQTIIMDNQIMILIIHKISMTQGITSLTAY